MIPTPTREPARTGSLVILFVLTLIIYVGTAARPALLDDADGCHALAAREILDRNDWTVLHVNGIRWIEKPPLHYWLVAGTYAAIGESALATRLPIALAMVALVLLLYDFGRRFFGERAGFYAGLIMATAAGVFLFTRIMIPEAILALEFTAAFYLVLRAWTGTLAPRIGWWGFAALVGAATLTRAGIGALFPVAVVAAFVIAEGAWRRGSDARRRLASAPLVSSVAIALAVALPWHLLAALRVRGFLWFYFVNEQVLRALGRRYPADYTAVPLPLWWAAHLVWFFPWSVFLPCLWGELRTLRKPTADRPPADAARLLLAIWAAAIFGFFSIVTGSRMEYYSFGAWPAVALLVAAGITRTERQAGRSLARFHAALAVVGALCAAALVLLLWLSRGVNGDTDISSLLQRHDTDFYRVSMATLLDLTPQAFAALRAPAAMAAVLFLAGPIAAWWAGRRGRHRAAMIAMAIMMTAFNHTANLAFEAFEPRLSSRPLAARMDRQLRPDDRLVVYGEFEQACSFSFYTGRPALIYNGRYNGLEFGSRFPDAADTFLDDKQFVRLWQGPTRVFLFVPPDQRAAALEHLPPDARYVAAEVGGKTLYVNRDPAPGRTSLSNSNLATDLTDDHKSR
jgi:4-amino-4-deoxy-L-arabinose transferase-like glycosyltransferase